MNILVTGANGQLGQCIRHVSHFLPQAKFWFATSADLDITQSEKVASYFDKHPFDFCINTAAYTAVDKAETEKEKAFAVNLSGAENLAHYCLQTNTKLIHISTDFVFDGSNPEPYTEASLLNPLGVYGESKVAGEQSIQEYSANALIVRTSWLYATFGHNFLKTMLKLAQTRSQISVVYDQVGTPTFAEDLAKALLLIVSHIERNPTENFGGIYHYSNEGVCSWYDFAHAIFSYTKTPVSLLPIRSGQYPTLAKRPAYSVLDKQKIKQTFGLVIPHWQESLHRCLDQLSHAHHQATPQPD